MSCFQTYIIIIQTFFSTRLWRNHSKTFVCLKFRHLWCIKFRIQTLKVPEFIFQTQPWLNLRCLYLQCAHTRDESGSAQKRSGLGLCIFFFISSRAQWKFYNSNYIYKKNYYFITKNAFPDSESVFQSFKNQFELELNCYWSDLRRNIPSDSEFFALSLLVT